MRVYLARVRNVHTRGEWEEEGESPTRIGNCEWSLVENINDEGQAKMKKKKGERYNRDGPLRRVFRM